MKAIDKFILHVTHNLFPLNEYSEGEMKNLMNKFKEEAEDLNIEISDEQLKKYIERFDVLKNSPKVTDKDLRKYSLSKLIRLVTSMPGAEISDEEKEDDTPDVVYNDNGITIWNGAKQGNCITYGAGESWCITRPGGSYWGQYRYGSTYKYPTFYLAKNTNLSDSDKLSFVALQVLDNGDYKFTNRNNSPGMEGPFSWDELNRRIPWLSNIPNLKNILKYIPFSKSEKEREIYRTNSISIKQWMKEPFSVKKQYLIIRSGNQQLFSDISNDIFISKYLPQYPQIASAIAGTTGIINIDKLIQYIDKFSKQDQLSIVKQIRDKFDLDIFDKDVMFDLKKYLVKTNKINLKSNQRLYVTNDGQAIILLTLGDNIKVGLYTEEDDYPNIKLNKRTSKYLLDYPELDKIPLKNLIQLSEKDIIDSSIVEKVLDNAKKDSNSALVVKPAENGEIILDSNTFSSYKVDKNGKITSVPFDNEEVQQAFTDAKDNEGFQQNALNLFRRDEDEIPATIDKEALMSVINATPYSQRILQYGDTPGVVLTTDGTKPFLVMPATLNSQLQRTLADYGGRGNDWRRRDSSNNLDANQWASYFAYLRATNQTFNANGLKTMLGNQGWQMNAQSKKDFIASNPPIEDDSPLKTAMNGDTALLINTANPRESFKISSTGKLVKANIPNALARQLLGGQPAAAPGAGNVIAPRRGRPAGQPNAPRAAAQPAAAGNINVAGQMQEAGLDAAFARLSVMDRRGYRSLNVDNAARVDINGDRGATRRNNILGNAGRVGRVLQIGQSKIYIIRLANQQIVASINIQPGNRNYLLTGNENGNVALSLNSPSELLQVLQQRNLAEIHNYLVNEYLGANPTHLDEFKQLLRKHINEKNEQE